MSNILLTGGTGFIGSNIIKELSKENNIYTIIRKERKNINLKHKNIKILLFKNYTQLNSQLNKIKVETVIHCATHYVNKHSHKDIIKLSESNILVGNIVLENIQSMNVKKFINFSTVWEDYDSKKENAYNLYSSYKTAFSYLIQYYKKKNLNINFYNIMISDTFGKTDRRNKIINVLKNNYKNNLPTKILSKSLFLNLLNVEDIVDAVRILINKNIKPGQYVLKNTSYFKMNDLITLFNKKNKKKILVKWLSNKIIKEKIFPYKKLKSWKPKKSKVNDVLSILKNN
jgi:CDP-paratose synthetase